MVFGGPRPRRRPWRLGHRPSHRGLPPDGVQGLQAGRRRPGRHPDGRPRPSSRPTPGLVIEAGPQTLSARRPSPTPASARPCPTATSADRGTRARSSSRQPSRPRLAGPIAIPDALTSFSKGRERPVGRADPHLQRRPAQAEPAPGGPGGRPGDLQVRPAGQRRSSCSAARRAPLRVLPRREPLMTPSDSASPGRRRAPVIEVAADHPPRAHGRRARHTGPRGAAGRASRAREQGGGDLLREPPGVPRRRASTACIVGCGALHVMWEDLAEVRTLAVAADMLGTGLGGAPRGTRRGRPPDRRERPLLPDLRGRLLPAATASREIEGQAVPRRSTPSCCAPTTRAWPSSSTSSGSSPTPSATTGCCAPSERSLEWPR